MKKIMNLHLIIALFFVYSTAFATINWSVKLDQAENYYKNKDYKKAVELYQEIAENKAHAYSQFKLGWIYSNGLGLKKDNYVAAIDFHLINYPSVIQKSYGAVGANSFAHG